MWLKNVNMSKTITIPRTLANKLLTLAQQAPQAEVCGLIGKSAEGEHSLYPVQNIASDSACVFEMDPQQQIDAFRKMRDQQQQLFAIFHSHPHSAAVPSSRDLDEAAYETALNLIISLDTTGVLDMRGYYYHNDQAEAVDLVIE